MPSKLSETDRDIDFTATRDIPQDEIYTTPEGVHKRLQDWEEKVRTIARYDLLIAITEGVLLSVLIQQAAAPHKNFFQQAIAMWLIIHRTWITVQFQSQMRKLENCGLGKSTPKTSASDYLSVLIEGSAIINVIAFQQSIITFNKGSMMAYTIFPIMGIEFLSICFRILSRIILSRQIEDIATANKSATKISK